MKSTALAFGALALFALAGSALLAPRPLPARAPLRSSAPLGKPAAPAVALAAIPVSPPLGAVPSPVAVTPFQRPASPYLQIKAESYDVAMTPQEIYDYYLPLLAKLGFSANITGESCGPGAPCGSDWGFSRGQFETFLLTVQPRGSGASRYSAADDLIVPPARPKDSFVPADVQSVEVSVLTGMNSAWVSRTFTARAFWEPLRTMVNGLAVDTRGAHGCLADFGASAVVRFQAQGRTYTFEMNPACASVTGPGHTGLLSGFQLWDALVRASGVANPYHG
ncbi:MAG: hypothetical protein M0Z66_05040 [Thermaerobacter sp.]|nr:hypothetical protein [Thermaerobacter sp.]